MKKQFKMRFAHDKHASMRCRETREEREDDEMHVQRGEMKKQNVEENELDQNKINDKPFDKVPETFLPKESKVKLAIAKPPYNKLIHNIMLG